MPGLKLMIYCWGSNPDGHFGNDSKKDSAIPIPIISGEIPLFCDLVAGSRSAFGITSLGEFYASGANECGQLGLSNNISVSKFTRVNIQRKNYDLKIRQVSCGWCHTLILTEDGQVFVTGDGKRGQLGLGSEKTSTNVFVLQDKIEERAVQIACGLWSSFVVLESGQVMFWGQFRSIKRDETFSPILIDEMQTGRVLKISVGHKHILTLSNCGKVSGFGCNKYGQLALDSIDEFDVIVDIFTGWNHSIVQLNSGNLLLIGKNDKNQLASIDPNCRRNILKYEKGEIIQLAVGSDHVLLLISDGKNKNKNLLIWGWNEHGTLGQDHNNQTFGPPQSIDFDFKSKSIDKIFCGSASCFVITK